MIPQIVIVTLLGVILLWLLNWPLPPQNRISWGTP